MCLFKKSNPFVTHQENTNFYFLNFLYAYKNKLCANTIKINVKKQFIFKKLKLIFVVNIVQFKSSSIKMASLYHK